MCDLTVEEVAKLIDKAYEDEVNNYTELPEKLKNDRIKYTDSLLRQIRCETCDEIMEIEDLVYVHKDKGIADNGDINYVCGHNKGIGKAKSTIKEKR